MRAQNHQQIYRAYFKFSGYLALCVLIGVLSYFFFTQTSQIEVDRIVDKTEEYDQIYVKQTDLTNRIDSLYLYSTMFNTNLNDGLLLNSVSKRKQEILSLMENMSGNDIKLHWKLATEYNTFLGIKDSIRTFKVEEELVKSELLKCVENNRATTRRLRIGGITVNR